MNLAKKHCIPCSGDTPALAPAEVRALLSQLEGWSVVDGHHLERSFEFPDFASALAFTNRVGELADQEGHHPDIYLSWGQVRLSIWTHAVSGLTESDFILAAKASELER